ncbi:hypothetical protein V2J09_013073 [Rumex salicifolius]
MINGTKRRKFNRLELCRMPVLFELLCFLFLFSFEHNFSLCLGLNSEGSALLRFRERVVGDPFKALSSWNGGGYDADPCSWFGVQCSNGTVVALLIPAPSPSPSQKAHSPEHAKKTNSSSSPISSPSPSKKVHSPAPTPAPAPAKMNNTTSSPKKAPVGGPSVLSNSSPSPSSASTANGKATKSHGVVIWLSVVGGSLAVVLTVIAIFVCRSSKVVTVKPWATGLSGQLQRAFVSGVPKLKRAELETACEDFSNIIGTLTDSTVYKGTLSSGVEIAVVSSSVNSRKEWSRNLEMQFRKKVETLSKENPEKLS